MGSLKPSVEWLDKQPDKYEIYDCEVCGTRFADSAGGIDYEFVFQQTDLYANQLEFARRLKWHDDPTWALIGLGHPYYAIFDFVRGKKELEILDVGCSYGYVPYGLNLMGHKAVGIDVARQPIHFAKGLFGDYYFQSDIGQFIELNPTLKYDLVIAIEVLEHLTEPMNFVENCLKALKPNGSLLLTTPNGDFIQPFADRAERAKDEIWMMEKPPVHAAIYNRKAMEYIAKETGTKLSFTEFPGLAERSGSLNMAAIFTKNAVFFNRESGLRSHASLKETAGAGVAS